MNWEREGRRNKGEKEKPEIEGLCREKMKVIKSDKAKKGETWMLRKWEW